MLLLVPSCYTNASLEDLTIIQRHKSRASYINVNDFYAITKIFLRKLTFTKYQAFLRNFYATKIWSYTLFDFA